MRSSSCSLLRLWHRGHHKSPGYNDLYPSALSADGIGQNPIPWGSGFWPKSRLARHVTSSALSKLPAVVNHHLVRWLTALSATRLNGLHDVRPLRHLAEDHVLAVEPGRDHGRDEELRAVGVRAGVGHGEEERPVVFALEVLVVELGAVDGLAAGSVVVGEVTSLEHELGDDAVKARSLVAKPLLMRAERPEVLGGLWYDVVVQFHDDASGGLAVDA